jgi:hypothetical protein
MEVNDQLDASGRFTPDEREHDTQLDRSLGEHRNRSGLCGVERKFLSLPGIELRPPSP